MPASSANTISAARPFCRNRHHQRLAPADGDQLGVRGLSAGGSAFPRAELRGLGDINETLEGSLVEPKSPNKFFSRSSVLRYLRSVQAAGIGNTEDVMTKMREEAQIVIESPDTVVLHSSDRLRNSRSAG